MIELTREIHFWQTWWFWVLTSIILFFTVFIFIRSRIERSRRNQVRLEVKIAERTREIRLQKTKIEEQNRLIEEEKNKRVTGIGGFFFKSKNSKELLNWYANHLGFDTNDYGCSFVWKDENGKDCITQWSPFQEDTNYFDPSKKEFMQNFRVQNLEKLMDDLKKEGVTIVGEMETYSYGKFAWILDPEENKIELWEPIDKVIL